MEARSGSFSELPSELTKTRDSLTRNDIQVLLAKTDKESLKDAKYKIFIPKVIEKKVSKTQKTAIIQIAKLDLTHSLPITLSILYELISNENEIKQLKEFIDTNKNIRKSIEVVESNGCVLNDFQSLFFGEKYKIKTEWEKLTKGLSDLIDNKNNQLTEVLVLLCKELQTWLEGLYLHACIHSKIKEFRDLIFSTKDDMILLAPHPIKELVETIPKGIKVALEKMGTMDKQELLPIIIFFLEDCLKNIMNNAAHEKTKNTYHYYIKVFSDTDEALYMDHLEQLDYLNKKKDEIRPGLKRMVEIMKELNVDDKNVRQDFEFLKILFEGYYLNTYLYNNTILGKGVNFISNRALKSVTQDDKLTVMTIAKSFLDAALILEQLLNPKKNVKEIKIDELKDDFSIVSINTNQNELDSTVVEIIEQTDNEVEEVPEVTKMTVALENLTTEDNSKTIDNPPLLTNADNKHDELETTTHVEITNQEIDNPPLLINADNKHDELETITHMEITNQEIDHHDDNIKFSEKEIGFWDILLQVNIEYSHKNQFKKITDSKINALYDVVMENNIGIPDRYKAYLRHLKPAMDILCKSYEADTYLKYLPGATTLVNTIDSGLKFIFPKSNFKGTFSRAHANLTKTHASLIESATEPDDLLKILFNMRQALAGKNSTHLAPSIDLLLESAYDTLRAKVPSEFLQPESLTYSTNNRLTLFRQQPKHNAKETQSFTNSMTYKHTS